MGIHSPATLEIATLLAMGHGSACPPSEVRMLSHPQHRRQLRLRRGAELKMVAPWLAFTMLAFGFWAKKETQVENKQLLQNKPKRAAKVLEPSLLLASGSSDRLSTSPNRT